MYFRPFLWCFYVYFDVLRVNIDGFESFSTTWGRFKVKKTQVPNKTSTRLSRRRPYMNTYTLHTPIWVSDRPTGNVGTLQLNSVLCLYLVISISIMFQSKLIIKFQYMYISVTEKISVNFGNFKNQS